MIWLAAAVFGLSLIAQTAQPVFILAKYLGTTYLLWLAFKLWTASPELPPKHEEELGRERFRHFTGGLALALGNPKTMVFYIALAPALVDLTNLALVDVFLFEVILVIIYAMVLTTYVSLAARARRFIRSSNAVRYANRATGAVMVGAAVLVATR
jgi:threonine/homoserine/homoserine lactone efflux protein